VVKSWPQDSQNWPVRAAPHCGQASAAAGAATVAVAPPSGSATAGDGGNSVAAPMRMPHTSQKSSLAESWPDGQVAIAIPS
jgi:hypothetical protein